MFKSLYKKSKAALGLKSKKAGNVPQNTMDTSNGLKDHNDGDDDDDYAAEDDYAGNISANNPINYHDDADNEEGGGGGSIGGGEEKEAGKKDVVAEEDEEEVYEVTLLGKSVYVTNEIKGEIFAKLANGDVGDKIGFYTDGVPMYERNIQGRKCYFTNDQDGRIFKKESDGSVGTRIGFYKSGIATFTDGLISPNMQQQDSPEDFQSIAEETTGEFTRNKEEEDEKEYEDEEEWVKDKKTNGFDLLTSDDFQRAETVFMSVTLNKMNTDAPRKMNKDQFNMAMSMLGLVKSEQKINNIFNGEGEEMEDLKSSGGEIKKADLLDLKAFVIRVNATRNLNISSKQKDQVKVWFNTMYEYMVDDDDQVDEINGRAERYLLVSQMRDVLTIYGNVYCNTI